MRKVTSVNSSVSSDRNLFSRTEIPVVMHDEDQYSYTITSSYYTVKFCRICGIPLQLSRDTGHSKSCAYKEFRFPPPFPAKVRKDKKRKKLPPIPENMLPKRHNSFEEVDLNELVPLPSISPTMISDKVGFHQVSHSVYTVGIPFVILQKSVIIRDNHIWFW